MAGITVDPFLACYRGRGRYQHWPARNQLRFTGQEPENVLPGQGRAHGNKNAAQYQSAEGFDSLVSVWMVRIWLLTGQTHDRQNHPIRCHIGKGMDTIHQ